MIEIKRYRTEIKFPAGYNAENCETDLPIHMPIFKNYDPSGVPVGRTLNHWTNGKEWHCDFEIWDLEVNIAASGLTMELGCGVAHDKPKSCIMIMSIHPFNTAYNNSVKSLAEDNPQQEKVQKYEK